MKTALIVALKVFVAAALVAFMLHGGALDLGALRVLVDRPELIVASLLVIALAITLAAVRWRLLLRVAGVDVSFPRALQLQLVGQFFNIVIPGGIGGDVIKAIYVGRDVEASKRPAIYLIGFVDRLIGVAGIVVIAAISLALHGRDVWQTPGLRGLGFLVMGLTAATCLGPIVLLVVVGKRREAGVSGPSWLARTLDHLVRGLRLVASRPGALATALLLAVGVHVLGAAIFAALTIAITPHDVSLLNVATVYPLGMLTVMVPISYAGIGVGHVAFERLFELVGMVGGANAFNVYLFAQTAPCLVGVFPYLTLRRNAAPPSAVEAAG